MRNAAQTAFLMAILTLVSKFLGFIREMVIANFFGASYITDAYVMANAIPGILFGGIFIAVATAFMPVFSRIREDKGEIEGDRFTSGIINLIFILSIFAGIIGLTLSDKIVSIFASGFTGEVAELTSFYLKVTFWYIMFTSTNGVINSYLQYKGIFLPQVAAGFAQNIGIIIIVIISGLTSHIYLAFGMLIGTAVNFCISAAVAKKNKFQYTFTFSIENSIKKIMYLAIPVFISNSIMQINTFVDKTLASTLVEGSVAALNYANLLVTLATSITTSVIVTMIYPRITKANSLEDYGIFNDLVEKGIMIVIIIAIPCALGSMTFDEQVVRIVYERGAFNADATALASSAFFYYAIGLPFLALIGLLTNIYYSLHNMKTPIICAGLSVIINIVLNLLLVGSMAHKGLALATSISYSVNAALLYTGLKQKYRSIVLIKSITKLLKVILASIISVGLSWVFYTYILPFTKVETFEIITTGLAVVLAILIYILLLIIFNIKEIELIRQLIKR